MEQLNYFVYNSLWIAVQLIVISFENVTIDCDTDDELDVYNEYKTSLLYNYCAQMRNSSNDMIRFVIATARYLIVRLRTTSSRLLYASFNTHSSQNIDELDIRTETIATTTTKRFNTKCRYNTVFHTFLYSCSFNDLKFNFKNKTTCQQWKATFCSPSDKEYTEKYGSISCQLSTLNPLYSYNQSWLIRANPTQVCKRSNTAIVNHFILYVANESNFSNKRNRKYFFYLITWVWQIRSCRRMTVAIVSKTSSPFLRSVDLTRSSNYVETSDPSN